MAAIAVDLHQPRDGGLFFAGVSRRRGPLTGRPGAAWVRAATAAMTALCACSGLAAGGSASK
jgi:hypothetical protein